MARVVPLGRLGWWESGGELLCPQLSGLCLWQKRDMSVEKETHSNGLEEELVPTKVDVSLAGTSVAGSTGKTG